MYPKALDCEILPEQFWNLSPAEICDLMESYSRRKLEEFKLRISMHFVFAKAVARDIGATFDEKMSLAEPWDYYPGLFKGEMEEALRQKEQEEFESFKERRRGYAAEFNRRRHEEK